jgi:sulfur carrier protein
MNILLNGETRDVSAASLDAALTELGFGGACVATALNGAFVAAPRRATTVLRDGDRVEVVAPMQGG